MIDYESAIAELRVYCEQRGYDFDRLVDYAAGQLPHRLPSPTKTLSAAELYALVDFECGVGLPKEVASRSMGVVA